MNWRKLNKLRFRRRRSFFKRGCDVEDTLVQRECLLYLIRHLERYFVLDQETIEFLSWVVGDGLNEIYEYALKNLTKLQNKSNESGVNEFSRSYEENADALGGLLSGANEQDLRKVKTYVLQILKERYSKLKLCKNSEIEKTVIKLQKSFNISDVELAVCVFLFITSAFDPPEDLFLDHLNCSKFSGRRYLQNILGISLSELDGFLSSKLVKIGLVEVDKYDICLSNEFFCLFQSPSAKIFSKKFYRKVPRKTLPLASHFVSKEDTNHILRILKNKTFTPTHILIYGSPGTGKTSYAQSLLNTLGIPAYQIAHGEDNTSKNRLAALAATLNMTNNGDGSILVVDEADNILNTQTAWMRRGETQDKGYLNHLLDEAGVRIVWICNDIGSIEGSVLRRFAYSLKFKPFDRKQRMKLWENIVCQNRVKRFFSRQTIYRLASKYSVNAGIINLSIKKAVESHLKTKREILQMVEGGLHAHLCLMNSGREPKYNMENIERNYSLEGLNISGNPRLLIDQLVNFDAYLCDSEKAEIRNMNILFYGPPGTGKSEMARYIAKYLGKEILCKRLSDILSKWVGGSEQNIKSAFEEAERINAVLIIDEADSLLFSRENAVRSWETSMINEFLTQMERFRGILIGTTNLLESLDSASIRRFSIKLGFDYLSPDGNVVFYKKLISPLINTKIDQQALDRLVNIKYLTPGDFKTIRNKFHFYPENEVTHRLLVKELREESRIKNVHGTKNCIGF